MHRGAKPEKQTVVIDTDAGIDDAWAILMVLASMRETKLMKVAGITCVHGNTTVEQVCINVLRTLESSEELDVPVFKGAASPLIGTQDAFRKNATPFFGTDGFGGAEHTSKPDLSLLSEENAVAALNRIVSENKGNVSLLCLGPLTNIALAIRTYSTFEENLLEVIIMGGNYKAVGNASNCAEFNFHADPEAANIVLNSAIKRKVLVPWEACREMAFSLDWRDNVLGACENASVQLMNRVERPRRSKPSFVDWVPCDQVAVAMFLQPEVARTTVDTHLTVELHGQHTRGQVVVSHKIQQQPNTVLVKRVNQDLLSKIILKVHAL